MLLFLTCIAVFRFCLSEELRANTGVELGAFVAPPFPYGRALSNRLAAGFTAVGDGTESRSEAVLSNILAVAPTTAFCFSNGFHILFGVVAALLTSISRAVVGHKGSSQLL